MIDTKPITILLSTFNGIHHISEQLHSLEQQTYKDFHLLIRDDGSSDDTVSILKQFMATSSLHVTLLPQSSNIGVRRSFATLLEYAIQKEESDYFMFCDQDDIWFKDKVEHTFKQIKSLQKSHPETLPLLVHTDLQVVDDSLHVIAPSFWHYEHINPAYNALNRLLMQNTVTGCTVMINRSLAQHALPIPNECIMHDWWIALVAAAFGKIGYSNKATILYRQHNNNDTGAKHFSYKSIPRKIWEILLKDDLYMKLNRNFSQSRAFLKHYEPQLSEHYKETLNVFVTLPQQSWLQKRHSILKYRLFKNGIIRNLAILLRA